VAGGTGSGRFLAGRSAISRPTTDRIAIAAGNEVVVSPRPERSRASWLRTTPKSLRIEATDDTMILAYLIEPGRAEYAPSTILAAEYGVELLPVPEAEEETAAPRPAMAAATLRLREPMLERVPRAWGGVAVPRDRAAADRGGWAAMESAGGQGSTPIPDGRDHTARLADRVEELEAKAVRAGGRGVHARLDPAGGADPVRAAAASRPGRKGKTGYSTDTRRAANDPRLSHEIVGVIEEWREYSKAAQHLPRGPLADA